MIGDHHGRTAGSTTLLVRAVDDLLGTHRVIVFLLSIPLLHGRWKPSGARKDEQEHKAKVQAERARLTS